ncbi:DUF4912 domain-containing protein [Cytobacillus sp. NCCP-133]|uniref:DUF4912 domain-containing protein n=1 Tax=Cytobacillus sp. NCCP-133 TaxID=766848 RepID=UPI002230F4BA|nr:DUF4912 domain-containing protein [Cytobacillus sp. NCCP-133]GLB58202.1 hypothetical protein NCCP133_03350 [Cytobacillus sp. NCCP-133]
MIDDIIKLRRRGLSFRKIARELDTTVGKVQYQWTKLIQNKAKRSIEEPSQKIIPVQKTDKEAAYAEEDKITLTPVSNDKVIAGWKLSVYKENMAAQFFDRPIDSWRKALRIYDVTGVIFNGENAQSDHEVALSERDKEWTFKGLKPGRVYCIELGIKLEEDQFFPLLRSSALHSSDAAIEKFPPPKEGIQKAAEWSENVSTYTYYENIDEGED